MSWQQNRFLIENQNQSGPQNYSFCNPTGTHNVQKHDRNFFGLSFQKNNSSKGNEQSKAKKRPHLHLTDFSQFQNSIKDYHKKRLDQKKKRVAVIRMKRKKWHLSQSREENISGNEELIGTQQIPRRKQPFIESQSRQLNQNSSGSSILSVNSNHTINSKGKVKSKRIKKVKKVNQPIVNKKTQIQFWNKRIEVFKAISTHQNKFATDIAKCYELHNDCKLTKILKEDFSYCTLWGNGNSKNYILQNFSKNRNQKVTFVSTKDSQSLGVQIRRSDEYFFFPLNAQDINVNVAFGIIQKDGTFVFKTEFEKFNENTNDGTLYRTSMNDSRRGGVVHLSEVKLSNTKTFLKITRSEGQKKGKGKKKKTEKGLWKGLFKVEKKENGKWVKGNKPIEKSFCIFLEYKVVIRGKMRKIISIFQRQNYFPREENMIKKFNFSEVPLKLPFLLCSFYCEEDNKEVYVDEQLTEKQVPKFNQQLESLSVNNEGEEIYQLHSHYRIKNNSFEDMDDLNFREKMIIPNDERITELIYEDDMHEFNQNITESKSFGILNDEKIGDIEEFFNHDDKTFKDYLASPVLEDEDGIKYNDKEDSDSEVNLSVSCNELEMDSYSELEKIIGRFTKDDYEINWKKSDDSIDDEFGDL